ncbi:hypothetical protein ACSBR2_033355 [Camellia fascicularis]
MAWGGDDMNTRFFHQMANAHRVCNFINKIQIGDKLISSRGKIRESIVDFYEHVYSESTSWET